MADDKEGKDKEGKDKKDKEEWDFFKKAIDDNTDVPEQPQDFEGNSSQPEVSEQAKDSEFMPGPFGKGSIYYQRSSNPDIFIGGTSDLKLIEATRTIKYDRDTGLAISEKWITTKTFTACIIDRMIKHKNILEFLELQERFTMKFSGTEPSGNFTVKQKTIPEIVSYLKNGNALTESGIEVAINCQLKAFEQRKLLETNDDMSLTGFFTDESGKHIISSNVKFLDINVEKLQAALKYINELASVGFIGRLDLLAHAIKFAIIAPFSFIFKCIRAPWLEWIQLYGKPNAGKSTSGLVILALDGHETDYEFVINMGHVDSIARLGEAIRETTFPKLIDEIDFTNDPKVVNNVKIAVQQPILRRPLDRYRRGEPIPACSACIMTSNPSPPLHDGAFMKRVVSRYFPDNETHLKDEEQTKEYDKCLLELPKLVILGQFRNQFAIANQDVILDKQLTAFDKSRKMLIAAYEYAGMVAPGWLIRLQLEQTQLEKSIDDNKEAVLKAFEKLIMDKFKTYKNTQDLQTYTNSSIRLENLVNYNLVPFVRRIISHGSHTATNYFAINSAVVKELHEYGVSTDQLPNLKALSDYMGGKWKRSHGKTFIEISKEQLETYFEEFEE